MFYQFVPNFQAENKDATCMRILFSSKQCCKYITYALWHPACSFLCLPWMAVKDTHPLQYSWWFLLFVIDATFILIVLYKTKIYGIWKYRSLCIFVRYLHLMQTKKWVKYEWNIFMLRNLTAVYNMGIWNFYQQIKRR